MITCARESGICTEPNPNRGWPQARMRSPTTVVTVQPELMERSPSTKSMPTISPGWSLASSGEGAALPPAIAVMPQEAEVLAEARERLGKQSGGHQGRFDGDQELSGAGQRCARRILPAQPTRGDAASRLRKCDAGACSISSMSAIGVTPPIASLVKVPSFSASAPASLPSK